MTEKSSAEKAVKACENLILSQKKVVLNVCIDVGKIKNAKGWCQYKDVEFWAYKSSFPRIEILIPIEALAYLQATKIYSLGIAESTEHQTYMPSPAFIESETVPGSITIDGEKAKVMLTLGKMRYQNEKEGINEDVNFTA